MARGDRETGEGGERGSQDSAELRPGCMDRGLQADVETQPAAGSPALQAALRMHEMHLSFPECHRYHCCALPLPALTPCATTPHAAAIRCPPHAAAPALAYRYLSALLLSLNTMLHLELPHINVLSKMDLVRQYGSLGESLLVT